MSYPAKMYYGTGDSTTFADFGEHRDSTVYSIGGPTVEPKPVPKPDGKLARGVRRIGRNQPCPCGSGNKFKLCCIRKAP